MKQNKITLPALTLSGVIALITVPIGAQDMPKDAKPQKDISQSMGRQTQGLSSEKVKEVQQALKDKGHDPGAIDGVMGRQTQQALRGFQQGNGLKATGRLDGSTAEKLGISISSENSGESRNVPGKGPTNAEESKPVPGRGPTEGQTER